MRETPSITAGFEDKSGQWVKECGQILEAEKDKKTESALAPPHTQKNNNNTDLQTLEFIPVRNILDLWPLELKDIFVFYSN